MNVLFIGAHPDDLEIGCGGTIAKYVANGHKVVMAVATNGNVGSRELSPSQIAEVREEEARKAAAFLGAAELIWMDEPDEFLFDNEPTRRKFIDAIRKARADVVITHCPSDYHPDHNACAKLVMDSRIPAAVPLVKTVHDAVAKAPEVFFMDAVAGINFQPGIYVDISDYYEKKLESVRMHKSQEAWVSHISRHDFYSKVRIQSEFRGMQIGVKYAEGFLKPAYWPCDCRVSLLP